MLQLGCGTLSPLRNLTEDRSIAHGTACVSIQDSIPSVSKEEWKEPPIFNPERFPRDTTERAIQKFAQRQHNVVASALCH